jgi:hypothetical protein
VIPIPIVWTEYTTVLRGRVMKLVCCEGCATEYVYELEREGQGAGKSLYMLDEAGAEERAKAGAEEALQSYLANDFDPIPCPACGHYQRFMFPKLYGGPAWWVSGGRLAALVLACVAAAGAVYGCASYFLFPGGRGLGTVCVSLAALALLGAIVAALTAVERSDARRFDPNTEDQHSRIEKGRCRAVTRAEFEAAQQREREARDQFIERLREKSRQDKAKSEKEPTRPDSG